MKIALGDLSYFSNEFNLYVPLNIGYLAAATRERFPEARSRLFKEPNRMLQYIRDERPDAIGLSLYYWNAELTALMIRKIRAESGYDPMVIIGGPCVDSDAAEQAALLARFPGADVLVPNEGEEGFLSVIGGMLAGEPRRLPRALPGGLQTNLAAVPSPYLDGTLDEFLTGPYQPMLQTSRLCPYTCSFCVSGKNRGKLRAFPLDQVRAEVDFIATRFADRPQHCLYVVDENFGILERDIEIAEMIRQNDYPRRVFYYNDKRFTQTSRTLQEVLGERCHHGVTLSLQSENPETLKAIKRRNLTDDQIADAIRWAHALGLRVTTELIFGLPFETSESFLALLDKCARMGFDAIQCYNLIVFDGIEMNRQAYRDQHRLRTVRREIDGAQAVVDGEPVGETEEVVVETAHFSPDDYRLIRSLNVMFHAIFVLGVDREYFREAVSAGKSLTGMLRGFLADTGLPGHSEFLADLNRCIAAEIAGERSEVVKLQPVFASRLAAGYQAWGQTAMRGSGANERLEAVS